MNELITPFSPAGSGSGPAPVASPPPPAAPTPSPTPTPTPTPASTPSAPAFSPGPAQHATDVITPFRPAGTPATPPTPLPDTPPPAAAGATAPDLLADGSAEEEPDLFADEAPAANARENEDRAARRRSNTRATDLERENEELRQRAQQLEANQITDADVKAYQAMRVQAQENLALRARVHYNNEWRQAATIARSRGEEDPPYDVDGYVREVTAQPALTRDDVVTVMRQEMARASQEGEARFERRVAERDRIKTEAEFKDGLRKQFKSDPALKDRPQIEQQILARGLFNAWEKGGRKGTAEQYARAVTAVHRKAAQAAVSARAEHARQDIPLHHGGGGAIAPSAPSILDIIDQTGMEPDELFRRIQAGEIVF